MKLPFTTDGCSGGMSWLWRKIFKKAPPWEGKCVEHDRTYWKGGTASERLLSDVKLCCDIVLSATTYLEAILYMVVAIVTFVLIRIFGVPYLPTSWRWGYGNGRKFGHYNE